MGTVESVIVSQTTAPVVRERLIDVLAAAAFMFHGPSEEGFQSTWKRVRPPHKPEGGAPFDMGDPMFNVTMLGTPTNDASTVTSLSSLETFALENQLTLTPTSSVEDLSKSRIGNLFGLATRTGKGARALEQLWNGPITHQSGPYPPLGFPPLPQPAAFVASSAPTWNPSSINPYTHLLDSNIVGPSQVHAQDFRANAVSSPLGAPSRMASGLGQTGPPPIISQQTMDEDKMSVSIDFGRSSAPTAYINAHSGRQAPRFREWCVKYVAPMKGLRAITYRLTGLQKSLKAKFSKY